MKKTNLVLALGLVFGVVLLTGCGSSDGDNNDSSTTTPPPVESPDTPTPPPVESTYTYDFNSLTTMPDTLTLNVSETTGLTATPTIDDTQDAAGAGKSLALAITAAMGEKKVYLQNATHASASKVSFMVKLSQEAADAGFTGGKIYAKTGDSWTWSNGDWVSINPDEWTKVTWTPGTDSVDLSEIKELGLQFYAGDTSAAAADVKVYIDNILIE